MKIAGFEIHSIRNFMGKLALCLFASALIAVANVKVFAADKPVDVLMLGHYTPRDFEPWWPKFQAACAKEGVNVQILTEDPKRGLGYDNYTDELLRKFNVVVFSGILDNVNKTPAGETEVKAFRERLDAYYKSGGSIIWVPLGFQHWGTLWNKETGDKYDAKSLEEDIYDPPKTVDVNPSLNNKLYRYVWSTNVTAHPVTEKVKGLLFPTTGEWSWPGTVPMKYGSSWTILIRGMDSTSTIGNAAPAGSGRHDFKPEVKGSYSGAPEIVGVRDALGSSGRMMVLPFHPTHTWRNFNHFAFNDAMMLKGDGAHPSDGLRLFINGCKWLAEPSVKAGFGGYKPAKGNEIPPTAPFDWSTAAFPGTSWSGMGSWWDDIKQKDVSMNLAVPEAKDFKGLVGARTAASDGQGSVADYVSEAKKLGLSFIIFLENLEKCDDVRFAKLVEDCKAQTTDSFAAIPGYLYRDLGGNLHYAYNVTKLPLPENITPERQVMAPNDIVEQNAWTNGQGIAELGKMKLDLAFLHLFTSAAPYVYEGPKLVDDGLAKYCYSEGLGHQYSPVSLTIVRSPQEMAATAAAAHLTVFHADKLDAWHACFGREGQHPHTVYLTNGPLIKRWGALNPLGHPFWPGKDRLRIALEAESPVGLREVKIINANTGDLYRCFQANGAKTFSVTVDESHKNQWYLVPVVTDVNGRTAVGAGLATYQDGNRTWMMSDRLMGMQHGMGWDEKHKKLMKFGGWIGHPWTKPYEALGSYPPNPRTSELRIQGIDGGNVHSAALDLSTAVVTDAGTEPKIPAYRFRDALAAFDYAVMDYIGDGQFMESKRAKKLRGSWWETPDAQVPNQIADITSRTWAVRARYNAAVSVNVHDITVTFKRDAILDRVVLGGLRGSRDASSVLLMLKDRQGEFSWLVNQGDPFSRRGVLDAGGYIYPANFRGGAVGVVNLGPLPIDYDSAGTRSQLYVDGGKRQVKAGEQMKISFLSFQRPWQDQVNNQWLKQLVADFALGGGKPGYPFTLQQGKFISTNYALDLQSENGGAVVEIGKYALPHNLLLKAEGIAANAVAGRYDFSRKQLLTLPVFENSAVTSVNTTLGDTKLYVGELFRCDREDVLMSCVQDGADKLLLEVHNPTGKALKVKLTAVPGFTPLSGLDKTLDIPPFSSVKMDLPVVAGSLSYKPYEGE